MKPQSAKAKGRALVKAFKEEILKRYPDLHSDDLVVTSAGTNGEDLQLSPKARKYLPFSFEMKCQETLNIWSALKQSEGHSSYPGVLVFKRSRTKTYCCMEAETWLNLVSNRNHTGNTTEQSKADIENLLTQLKSVESRLKLTLMSIEN